MKPSRIIGVTAIALALGACNDEPRRGWDSDITLPEAQALLERGARRVDLELTPQGASSIANLLEIEHDDELLDTEQIEAELLGFADLEDRGACRGTLALDVPGVEVRFDSAVTHFGGLDDAPGCTAFVEHVAARLGEGARVRVEARRRPAHVPQDPDDPTFFADALILTDDDAGDARAAIELNVGPGNIGLCALLADRPSDCTGVLDILGAPVVAREDVTEVEAEDPTELLYFDVEDRVVQVDANGRALILEDGTVLRVVDGTRFDDGAVDIDAVEERVSGGEGVVVEGLAVLSPSAPTSLIGVELSLEAVELDDDDVAPRTIALSSRVVDVEPELGVIVLPSETDVLVDAMTFIDGDLTSLDELDQSIAAGAPVRAEVLGVLEILEPRGVVRADRLTLRRAGQAV
jgi:hypothetical protein